MSQKEVYYSCLCMTFRRADKELSTLFEHNLSGTVTAAGDAQPGTPAVAFYR